jgi:hypothetical protein
MTQKVVKKKVSSGGNVGMMKHVNKSFDKNSMNSS